ncbi:MAG: FkbM family methyltransferase [Burkholderiaceae bacterium]|nr:FkbM family methyltransferase [Burkholderiaceae bacterium]
MPQRTGWDCAVIASRAWIRFAPLSLGKWWLWTRVHEHYRDFTCRTIFGAKVTGNTKDLIQRHLYYFGVWEPHITRMVVDLLRPGDVFVDVGANIGYYTLLASRIVGPTGKVVAVEAAPWIHAVLERHVALNGLGNVRTVNRAATDKTGTLSLYKADDSNVGSTSLIRKVGEAVEVEGAPLATLLDDDEIARVKLLKIDVEGAELQVLAGLTSLLPRMRPDAALLIEVQGANAVVEGVFSLMRRHGFLAYQLRNVYSPGVYMANEPRMSPVRISHPNGFNGDLLFTRVALDGT